ncbi:hypothetical protein ACFV4N_00075 [Actinosynnema sp. NPDC059797]
MRRLFPLLPVLLVVACSAGPTSSAEPPPPSSPSSPSSSSRSPVVAPTAPDDAVEVPPDPLADLRDRDVCAVLDPVRHDPDSELNGCQTYFGPYMSHPRGSYYPWIGVVAGVRVPESREGQEVVDLGDGLVVHVGECGETQVFDVQLTDEHVLEFTLKGAGPEGLKAPQAWMEEHICPNTPDLVRQLEPTLRELPLHPEGALADPCAAAPGFTDLIGGGEATRTKRYSDPPRDVIDECDVVGPGGGVWVEFRAPSPPSPSTNPRVRTETLADRQAEVVPAKKDGEKTCHVTWHQRNRAEGDPTGSARVVFRLPEGNDGDPCPNAEKAAVAVIEELDR